MENFVPSCRITQTYGMFDAESDEYGRDERVWVFNALEKLWEHIRMQRVRFADVLSEARADPECELNTLGPEYVGVAFAIVLEHESGSVLNVGVAQDHWVILPKRTESIRKCDGPDSGRLVVYFEDWTEWRTSDSYTKDTGKEIIGGWFASGVAA